ncbi:hypothetical protein [Pseudofrankia sp. DC12]|uniref:hypothetical protein n=1 Tax=Pseudofrankia sp. DC12 TaxID=683315 RepID=UPI0005F80B8A|nr:hypothetical protein [Pseudofrankia sp. DC12]
MDTSRAPLTWTVLNLPAGAAAGSVIPSAPTPYLVRSRLWNGSVGPGVTVDAAAASGRVAFGWLAAVGWSPASCSPSTKPPAERSEQRADHREDQDVSH